MRDPRLSSVRYPAQAGCLRASDGNGVTLGRVIVSHLTIYVNQSLPTVNLYRN